MFNSTKISIAVGLIVSLLLFSGCGKITRETVDEMPQRQDTPQTTPTPVQAPVTTPTAPVPTAQPVVPPLLNAPVINYYWMPNYTDINVSWGYDSSTNFKKYIVSYKHAQQSSWAQFEVTNNTSYVFHDAIPGNYQINITSVDKLDQQYPGTTLSLTVQETIVTSNLFGGSAGADRYSSCWGSTGFYLPYQQEVQIVCWSDPYVTTALIKLDNTSLVNYSGSTALTPTTINRTLSSGNYTVSSVGICYPPSDPNSPMSYRAQQAIYGRDHGVRAQVYTKRYQLLESKPEPVFGW